jgi:hypothetical protein
MKLKIEINCDNAAFDPASQEVIRLLEHYVDWMKCVEAVPKHWVFTDYNGNRVGTAKTS